MPGYGYAKAPKSQVRRWQALARDFLRGRAPLRRVFVLLDARQGLRPNDLEIMDLLDASAVSYQAVITKADKIRPEERERLRAALALRLARRPAAHPQVHLTSARRRLGLEALRAGIAALLPGG